MNLYLVQHGEAVPESENAERPLTATGRADIERLARFLADGGVSAERVINSGKLRARDSAHILGEALAPHVAIEDHQGLSPKHSTEDMADLAQSWTTDTLVVGHRPFMSRYVSRLVLGRETPSIVDFVPGTAVCLVRRTVTGAWFIGWMTTPELLRR